MKSLVVDDDFTTRFLLHELLRRHGCCDVAVNGLEAVESVRLAYAHDEPYDLICLDIMMPELDGQAALKEIREIEQSRGVRSTQGSKIIMVTVLEDIKSVFHSFMGLCDAYLFKPVDKRLFLGQLSELGLLKSDSHVDAESAATKAE